MRSVQQFSILNGVTANTVGQPALLESFRHISLTLSTLGSAQGVVKFAKSDQEEKPDFSAAASPTNKWDYVQVVDVEDGALIAGNTGVTFSGTDAVRHYEVNTNYARWIVAIVSGYAAGTFYVEGCAAND